MNEFHPANLVPLIRREWYEHRGLLGWTQLGVLVFVVMIILLALAFGTFADVQAIAEGHPGERSETAHFEGRLLNLLIPQLALFAELSPERIEHVLAQARGAVAMLFQGALLLTVVFYLAGSLYDDRKDHSVLFWKSMPVSDTETVVAKLLVALFVAPAIAIAAIFVAQVLFFVIATFLAWSAGVSAWSTLWAPSGLLTGLVLLVSGYILQAFWALPVYAWLLAVSAFASRAPLLWAGLGPLLVYILERVVFGRSIIGNFFYEHIRLRAVAPIGTSEAAVTGNTAAASPLANPDALVAFLTSLQFWGGVVVGAGLIVAAIYLRRRNNEI